MTCFAASSALFCFVDPLGRPGLDAAEVVKVSVLTVAIELLLEVSVEVVPATVGDDVRVEGKRRKMERMQRQLSLQCAWIAS